MRPVRIYALPRAVDADGIAEAQTPGGAGSLTLDGALVVDGAAVIRRSDTDASGRPYSRIGQTVTVTSDGDDSGVTFTVTGLDQDGQEYSEEITGPNATSASSTGYFSEVTSVAIDGAGTGSITVGIAATFATPTIPLDHYIGDGVAQAVVLGGTATYTVQHTFDNVQVQTWKDGYSWDAAGGNWLNHDSSDFVDGTATADGNYQFVPKATRLKCTAWTSGTVEYDVISARMV